MSVADGLPHEVLATCVEKSDPDGPYWEVRIGDRMLAYCEEQASAELIVVALNTSTAFMVHGMSTDGGNKKQ
jgi:hypothetical protein